TLRHDESQNKFRMSSVWQKLDVVARFSRRVTGADPELIRKSLLKLYGNSKKTVVNRWMRSYASLPTKVLEHLRTLRTVPDVWVFDNVFFLGPGQQKLKADDAIRVLNMAVKMREDGAEISENILKSQICPAMLSKSAWVKTMHSTFGGCAKSSAAMVRVTAMLETRSGLNKVLACMASNVPLHGVSDENPGIHE
ncbi:unnamed protein product, partial [Symbiodinium sp. CCMP2592]